MYRMLKLFEPNALLIYVSLFLDRVTVFRLEYVHVYASAEEIRTLSVFHVQQSGREGKSSGS